MEIRDKNQLQDDERKFAFSKNILKLRLNELKPAIEATARCCKYFEKQLCKSKQSLNELDRLLFADELITLTTASNDFPKVYKWGYEYKLSVKTLIKKTESVVMALNTELARYQGTFSYLLMCWNKISKQIEWMEDKLLDIRDLESGNKELVEFEEIDERNALFNSISL